MRRALVLLAFLAIPAHAEQDGITVQGQRDQRKLRQGQWEVSVTPAYHYGSNLDKTGNMRAMGKARSWRFCLPETQVEAMVRLLVGEGHTAVAGTTDCQKLQVTMGKGRLRAIQHCVGGNVTQVDENPMKTKTVPTRLDLTVVGRYEASSLKLEFQDLRDLLYRDPGAPGASRSSSSRRISPGTTCRKPMTGRSTGPM
jgi:hypothetical protein